MPTPQMIPLLAPIPHACCSGGPLQPLHAPEDDGQASEARSPEDSPIGIGIIGMGFMGQTHLDAYEAANADGHACRLIAVCDADATRRGLPRDRVEGNIRQRPTGSQPHRSSAFVRDDVRGYADPVDLIRDPDVHAISICTPTETHAPLALSAIRAGKHVLVEKPLAVTAEGVQPVLEALRDALNHAERSNDRSFSVPLCMPALCMRFWPGWSWLAGAVRDRRYGAVRSARFTRLAAPPAWSPDFYRDATRTGGALVDLHVHDTDFIVHLFGLPRQVQSAGSLDHVTTLYAYHDPEHPEEPDACVPLHVVAEGGWDHAPGFDFRMQYVIVFEHATVEFDSRRDDHPLTIVCDGSVEHPDVEPLTGYDVEVRHFLNAVSKQVHASEADPNEATASAICERTPNNESQPPLLDATVQDALRAAMVLDAERNSLRTGSPVALGALGDI